MTIAFIGYGNMALALAGKWAEQHDLIFSGRDPQKAAAAAQQIGHGATASSQTDAVAAADVVVIATPHQAVVASIAHSGGPANFAGKVVVDINNPVPGAYDGDFRVATYDGKSLAEALAAAAPQARVVKAFNLCQANLWAAPAPITIDGRQHVTPICGDDEPAKQTVGRLIEAVGSRPADMGGLEYAHHLEAMAALVIKLLFAGRDPMTCFQLIEPEIKPVA
ncbi:MAG: NAD(P)-binding domain-containing protein [Planctomycetota bacterium]